MEEIEYQGKVYVSIGSYLDNNDGIFYYFPENNDRIFELWSNYFDGGSDLITFWSITYFYFHADYDEDISPILFKYLHNQDEVKNFINKYYRDEEFSPIFLDFVYGQYYGKVVQPENFMFDSHVFIEKSSYDIFNNDILSISNKISVYLKTQISPI